MSDRPFRTEVRRLGEEELAEINQAQGRTGEDAFRPLAEEVDAMMAPGEDWSDAAVARWAEHPDERVPMVAAHSGIYGNEMTRRIYERGRRDADAEDVLWTPVLNALVRSKTWPSGRLLVPGHPRPQTQEYTYGMQGVDSYLEPLATWLAEEATAADIDALLQFRNHEFWRLVAQHAARMSDEIADEILGSSWHFSKALENDAFVRERTDTLIARTLDWVRERHDSGRDGPSSQDIARALTRVHGTLPTPLADGLLHLANTMEEGKDALLLLHAIEALPEHVIARILEDHPSEHQRASGLKYWLGHASATRQVWHRALGGDLGCPNPDHQRDLILDLLKEQPTPDWDRVGVLYPAYADDEDIATLLLQIDGIPDDVLVDLAERHGAHNFRIALARHDRAPAIRGVADALLLTTSIEVLGKLGGRADVDADLHIDIIRRLARRAPNDAVSAIRRRREAGAPVPLPYEAVAPLLQADDEAIRQAALAAVAKRSGGRGR